jgi:ribosomal protein L29
VNPHVLTVQRKSIARAHTAIRKEELAVVSSDAKEAN